MLQKYHRKKRVKNKKQEEKYRFETIHILKHTQTHAHMHTGTDDAGKRRMKK